MTSPETVAPHLLQLTDSRVPYALTSSPNLQEIPPELNDIRHTHTAEAASDAVQVNRATAQLNRDMTVWHACRRTC